MMETIIAVYEPLKEEKAETGDKFLEDINIVQTDLVIANTLLQY